MNRTPILTQWLGVVLAVGAGFAWNLYAGLMALGTLFVIVGAVLEREATDARDKT